NLIAFQYCLENGDISINYPDNPNNSWLNCAGLIHPNGRVIGLMPHPEAATSTYQHPNWPAKILKKSFNSLTGDGHIFFKDIIKNIIDSKNNIQRCK
ncbi:MAG: phosphoribosylformylglycinamidine synthase subunit PurQ, partial [Legionellales bacterium]|nr:phosphoribosylformylglycinamidine synthase subunit PurQ [Legionellales bacterium]